MKLYRETALRKKADEPTIGVLNLWHSLCKEKIGVFIEVMVGNRREDPRFATFKGELYTAIPRTVKGRVVLSLLLDSLKKVNSVIITHELGHWVLKLQGFRALICNDQPNCNLEILLNSMTQHPPLYALQRSFGHEPQKEIDSRTIQNVNNIRNNAERKIKHLQIETALLFADDLLNCSNNTRKTMKYVLNQKHPKTARIVKSILDIAAQYNLLNVGSNLKFSKRIVRELRLGNNWYETDEVKALKEMIQKAQANN